MELVRRNKNVWDPFDLLEGLHTDIDRVFNRTLKGTDVYPKTFNLDIEVREDSDHYVVSADLPGLRKEDFNISVQGNHLTIKGERKYEQKEKSKSQYYSERFYGFFSRIFELPQEVQADKVKASYKDGVLEVTLPKSENAKPKQINVDVK